MKKLGICLLCLLLLFNLSACTGAKQLSERLIVQGIGIDNEGGGYKLTLMYLDTENSIEAPSVKTLSASGNSIMDCMTNSITQTGKEPLYSQNLFILLGKNTAKSGFEQPLSFFTTYYESRPNVNIFVSDKTAADILLTEGFTPQQIGLLSENEKKSGRAMVSTLMQLESDLLSEIASPKTLCLTTDGKTVRAIGTAVFKKDRLSFLLSPEESLGALLVSGRADTASELVINEGANIDFTLSHCKSTVSPSVQNGTVHFVIKLSAHADLYTVHSKKEEMQKTLQDRATELCEQTIKKSVDRYHADVFGFLKRMQQCEGSYFKRLQNPFSALESAVFSVTADIKID